MDAKTMAAALADRHVRQDTLTDADRTTPEYVMLMAALETEYELGIEAGRKAEHKRRRDADQQRRALN